MVKEGGCTLEIKCHEQDSNYVKIVVKCVDFLISTQCTPGSFT